MPLNNSRTPVVPIPIAQTGLSTREVAVSEATQNKVVVRIPAVLHGMSKVAYCVLEIWREDSSPGVRCTRCRIVNDPPELPDGSYRVEFARYSVQTKKSKGNWESVFVVPEKRTAQAA